MNKEAFKYHNWTIKQNQNGSWEVYAPDAPDEPDMDDFPSEEEAKSFIDDQDVTASKKKAGLFPWEPCPALGPNSYMSLGDIVNRYLDDQGNGVW